MQLRRGEINGFFDTYPFYTLFLINRIIIILFRFDLNGTIIIKRSRDTIKRRKLLRTIVILDIRQNCRRVCVGRERSAVLNCNSSSQSIILEPVSS